MCILVVDDDMNIREVISEYLIDSGYNVVQCKNGLEALEIVNSNKELELIILDVMMPKMDGIECLNKIRQNNNIPIIMLTAKTLEEDKLIGFEAGADDYVVKPFSPKELIARVKAVLNRDKLKHNIFTYQELEVDFSSRIVKVSNEEVKLSPKEYDLLFYLIKNKNIALSREVLLTNVWGYDFFGDDRTVDTHIKTLRFNLGICRDYIITLRGMGYKFEYKD